jgi:hypothetical protein
LLGFFVSAFGVDLLLLIACVWFMCVVRVVDALLALDTRLVRY